MTANKARKLYSLITQHIASRIVAMACELRFDDVLSDKAISISHFANYFNFNSDAMFRMLRVLETYEIVELIGKNHVKKGNNCEALSTIRGPHLLESFVVMNYLQNTMETNKECYSDAFGKSFYVHMNDNEKIKVELQNWSEQTMEHWLFPAVNNTYDFTLFNRVYELGSDGSFLANLLKQDSKKTGLLLNKSDVIKDAYKIFEKHNVINRTEFIAKELAEHIPLGGDLYLFCRSLLNYIDEKIVEIITKCQRYIKHKACLLIIDFYLPKIDDPNYELSVIADINILTCLNGKLRTQNEWIKLMHSCNFKKLTFKIVGEETEPKPVLPMFIIELKIN